MTQTQTEKENPWELVGRLAATEFYTSSSMLERRISGLEYRIAEGTACGYIEGLLVRGRYSEAFHALRKPIIRLVITNSCDYQEKLDRAVLGMFSDEEREDNPFYDSDLADTVHALMGEKYHLIEKVAELLERGEQDLACEIYLSTGNHQQIAEMAERTFTEEPEKAINMAMTLLDTEERYHDLVARFAEQAINRVPQFALAAADALVKRYPERYSELHQRLAKEYREGRCTENRVSSFWILHKKCNGPQKTPEHCETENKEEEKPKIKPADDAIEKYRSLFSNKQTSHEYQEELNRAREDVIQSGTRTAFEAFRQKNDREGIDILVKERITARRAELGEKEEIVKKILGID